MRLGYANSRTSIEVIDLNVEADGAVFGQSGRWMWGIVPFTTQSRYLETLQLTPLECSAFLVFGFDGVWYAQARDDFSDEILRATMPDFTFLDDPLPACSAPIS